MLEEAGQIVDRMMTQRPTSLGGKHFSVQNTVNDPVPVHKPLLPINDRWEWRKSHAAPGGSVR
jgi:hypothetical protein